MYVVKFMVKSNEVDLCYSNSNNIFIQDLKTINGVKSRLKKVEIPENTIEIHIFEALNITDATKDILIEKIVL